METRISTIPATPKTSRNLILLGSVALAIGAFLPWGTVADVSVSGMKGDGIITLILGILALIFLFIKKIPIWVITILGIIGAGISVIDISEMSKTINSMTSVLGSLRQEDVFADTTGVGIGLYTTLIASILIIAGSLMHKFGKQKN